MNYQQLTLIGRATADAKSITSTKETQFATFSLAVNDNRGKDEEKETEVTYYDCMVFGKTQIDAVLAKVKKGTTLLVQGTPSIDAYINKKDEARPSIRVIAKEWVAVGKAS